MAETNLTSSELRSKLDSVRTNINSVLKTNEFGVEDTVQTEDPTMKDNYKSDHKSSVRCTVFFGPIWIAEIVGVEHREENSKTPVYHYASSYFSDVLDGKYIVRGNLYMYETKTNELQATIAKYKQMLKQEKYSRDLIKDIVSQRNNLFQADLNTRLITKYGVDRAAAIVTDALKRINSELITGRDWDVPKLIIVSGDISDPSPAIDVFDDITFDTSSKAILADGATQIRVISWFGKKRAIRDTPEKLTSKGKFRIDFDATVRNYMDTFFKTLRNSFFRTTIRELPLPVGLTPNNLGYIGNLPAAIAGWGPDLCVTPVKIEQFGLSANMDFQYDISIYNEEEGVNRATEILKENLEFQYRPYTYSTKKGRSVLANPWRYFFPDPDYLLQTTHFISRALPTHRALSYSWIIPPPAIPGAVPEDPKPGQAPRTDLLGNILLADSDYTYREEDAHAVTGSTLTAAFFTISMHSDWEELGTTYVRAPVRGFTYYPPVALFEKKVGKTNEVSIADFAPIVSADLFAVMNKKAIPGDLTPENSTYLRAGKEPSGTPIADAILDEKGKLISNNNAVNVSPLNNTQVSEPINGIVADEWFVLAPTIGVVGKIATLLDLALSLGGTVENPVTTEDLTLGIIGNVDKVNQYEIDLQYGFGTYPFGVGVDNISVQVFPLATPSSFVSGETLLGTLSLGFGSHARVSRALAAQYLVNSDCLKQDSINYIFSLTGFDSPGPEKKLNFSATWSKKVIQKAFTQNKAPLMLVRILSARPKAPFEKGVGTQAINMPSYVSAVTTVPSSKVSYTALIRCDRSYVAFDQRWPQDIFNSMARISATAGMDTFKPAMARSIQLFTGSVRIMKHHDILTGLLAAGGGGLGAVTSAAFGLGISTVTTSIKTVGILGSGILDSAEGIWNVAIHLPVISFAVETLDTLGIGLAEIFQDSYIQRGDSPVIMNLLRTAAYSQGARYILIKDKLTEIMAKDIFDSLTNLINEDTQGIYEGDEILKDASLSRASGKLYSRIDTQLVSSLNRYFSDNEWSVTRLYGESLDRLIGSIDKQSFESFNIGSQTSDVYIVTKRGPKPSAFVLDEAVKDVNSYKTPSPDPKGIQF